jgi:acyl-coenzyme A synthetase/AMP-(fatty) acid ligase
MSFHRLTTLELSRPAIEFNGGCVWAWGDLLSAVASDVDIIGNLTGQTVTVSALDNLNCLYSLLLAMHLGANLRIVDDLEIGSGSSCKFHQVIASRLAQVGDADFLGHTSYKVTRGFFINPEFSVELRTSGSSGQPKKVTISAEALQFQGLAVSKALELSVLDRQLYYMPLNYIYGLSIVLTWLASSGSLVVSQCEVARPTQFFQQLIDKNISVFSGVPYTYSLMVRWGLQNLEASILRLLTQAGGKLKERDRNALNSRSTDTPLVVMYGQTEFGGRIAQIPIEEVQMERDYVGVPLNGIKIYIAEPDENGEGEIFICSPSMCDAANEFLEYNAYGGQIYYSTGDYGRYNDGKLFVSGRNKNFIKIGGQRIPALAIEQLIETNFEGADCFIFSDSSRHERVLIAIFVSDPLPVASQAEMQRYLRKTLGDKSDLITCIERVPTKFVIFVGDVPRLPNGKPALQEISQIMRNVKSGENSIHIRL